MFHTISSPQFSSPEILVFDPDLSMFLWALPIIFQRDSLYEGALSQERACDKFRKIIAYIKVVRLMKKQGQKHKNSKEATLRRTWRNGQSWKNVKQRHELGRKRSSKKTKKDKKQNRSYTELGQEYNMSCNKSNHSDKHKNVPLTSACSTCQREKV